MCHLSHQNYFNIFSQKISATKIISIFFIRKNILPPKLFQYFSQKNLNHKYYFNVFQRKRTAEELVQNTRIKQQTANSKQQNFDPLTKWLVQRWCKSFCCVAKLEMQVLRLYLSLCVYLSLSLHRIHRVVQNPITCGFKDRLKCSPPKEKLKYLREKNWSEVQFFIAIHWCDIQHRVSVVLKVEKT